MPTFRYDKLVRANIPGWHSESGHTVAGRSLKGDELKKALIAKLHEEADEIPVKAEADNSIREELADVMQVLKDLMSLYDLDYSEVEAIAAQKAAKKGGFLCGQYINTVHMPTNDKWVDYCRQSPDKYPEIQE